MIDTKCQKPYSNCKEVDQSRINNEESQICKHRKN